MNQKTGFEHWVPLSEECRRHALAHLPRIGAEASAWCFPAEQDTSRPVDVWVMSAVLRRAYERAGLGTFRGGLWHPWRRKWATERKDLPLRDVAAAGGWRDPTTLLTCYQQPDEETIERVVLEAPQLRSRSVRGGELSPKLSPNAEGRLEGSAGGQAKPGFLEVTGVGIEPTTYGLKVRCSTN